MHKKFRAMYGRVRVNLGNDTFVDADGSQEGIIFASANTLEKFAYAMRSAISDRNGEIIEVSNDKVVFETANLTVTIDISNHTYEQLSDKETIAFTDLLNQPRQKRSFK